MDIGLYRLYMKTILGLILNFIIATTFSGCLSFSPFLSKLVVLTQETTAIYFRFMHVNYLNNVLQTCSSIKKIKSIIVLKSCFVVE